MDLAEGLGGVLASRDCVTEEDAFLKGCGGGSFDGRAGRIKGKR